MQLVERRNVAETFRSWREKDPVKTVQTERLKCLGPEEWGIKGTELVKQQLAFT